ncbi:MAG: hypothetical protein R6X33_16305 [Candidatus Brocadiia bacterium]
MGNAGDEQTQSLPFSTAAVFLQAAAILALELVLMRCFSVARWHHFSYLVIGAALLGFGASGTFLTFLGDRLERRFGFWVFILTLAFAASVPLTFRLTQWLPLDVQYVLYSARQGGLMFAHDFLIFVPFFLGACVLGLSLMHFEQRVHFIYGANLVGSGVGAAVATGAMFLMAPHRLLYPVAGLGVLAALCWAVAWNRRRTLGGLLVLLVGAGLLAESLCTPVALRIDQYKDMATLQRWAREGGARKLLTRYGPRARVDVYESPRLHMTMFAGLTATEAPPPQLGLLLDGHLTAPVLEVDSPEEASILDHTPMSLPYRLLERPRVLLLGETGGGNVWLAQRMGAAHVTVVQPNPQVARILTGPLAERSGGVLTADNVTVRSAGLREFMEHTDQRFDIIQIVSTEGPAAGVSALRSLHEDFLLTVEGMARCAERLTDRGIVSVTRGVQEPPRDNVKLLATLRAALERADRPEPGRHLVQVRNLLAATTLAFARPIRKERCAALRAAARELRVDVEWAACPGVEYGEPVHRIAGPEGEDYSWFHHAAARILSAERESFFRNWAFDVRPATDESPYFYNFFRWSSLPDYWQAYGRRWLTRVELGYVVLVFALLQVVLVGGVLILLPLLRLRRTGGGRLPTFLYFSLIGLAFLMLEMVCLLKFTYFLGDPIYSAAGVLAAFLVFSGLGSALSRRLSPSPRRAITLAALGVAALAVLYAVGLDPLFSALIGWPLPARFGVAVVVAAPAAFLMGWPLPNGLSLARRSDRRLVPWAWGANGFASVAASPLAVLLAIEVGYTAVLLLVALLYVLATLVSRRLG